MILLFHILRKKFKQNEGESAIRKETEEKLAASLTAESTDLLPFLPYLLQDFWELGSEPAVMVALLKKNLATPEKMKVLDLACGKGAVAIQLAKELSAQVFGFDLLPDFVAEAIQKAQEWQVDSLCHFACADANDVVAREKGYDCVVFGAAGNILGSPAESLQKLAGTLRPRGFVLIDEAYRPSDARVTDVKYQNYEYQTREEWLKLFQKAGLELVEEVEADEAGSDVEADKKALKTRAGELAAKFPDKKDLFGGYVQSQMNEYDDLEETLVGVTWLLQKIE